MNYKVFLKLIKPYKVLIAGTAVTLVAFVTLGLLMPWVLKVIIDRVLGSSDISYLYIILCSVILIYFIRDIFWYVSHYLMFYMSERIMFDIRKGLFKHIQSLSLRFYQEYRTGKLISNIISDVAMMQQMFSATLANTAMHLFMMIFIVAVLATINAKLTLICLLMVPLQFINFIYFKKYIQAKSMTLRERMSEISANLAETLNGMKVVKSFSKERTENRFFVSQLRPAFSLSIDLQMKGLFCWMIAELIYIFSLVAMIGAGGYYVSKGRMTLGDFVAFYTYMGMILGPINGLSNLSTVFSQGIASMERILKLLGTVPEIKECEHPIHLDNLKGNVAFNDVNFAYNGKPVLKNFNLKIKPGQKVALVGPSGSGKSTIANLILRFYDVSTGEILIDNTDIRKLHIDSYRNNIGIVLQEPFLFSGSIRDNIAYAKNTATEDEVPNAAKMANVEEFVNTLEKGYDTELGENGASLSGGQKQRIAIARAILNDPKILILDEATSALDTVSEYLVQEALDNLMKNRTTIIIAHRLSTIKNADLIVVMENGEIKQTGTHRQLMKQSGLYKDLYTTQEKKSQETAEHPALEPESPLLKDPPPSTLKKRAA